MAIKRTGKKRRTSLWERSNTIDKYRKAIESRIILRAEKDRMNGNIEQAIKRYEGFFQNYSVNQEIHYKVAELYIEINDKIRAGRHLFFKQELSEVEKECVDCFRQAYGNSPTHLLKKLLYKENFRIRELEGSIKKKLKDLIDEAVEESGTVPNFLKGIKIHLDNRLCENG